MALIGERWPSEFTQGLRLRSVTRWARIASCHAIPALITWPA